MISGSGSYSTSACLPRAGVLVLLGQRLVDRRLLQRQQRLAAHLLRQRRDVAVVEDLDAVDLAVDVRGHQLLGDLARVGVGGAVGEADVRARPGSILRNGSEQTPRRPVA